MSSFTPVLVNFHGEKAETPTVKSQVRPLMSVNMRLSPARWRSMEDTDSHSPDSCPCQRHANLKENFTGVDFIVVHEYGLQNAPVDADVLFVCRLKKRSQHWTSQTMFSASFRNSPERFEKCRWLPRGRTLALDIRFSLRDVVLDLPSSSTKLLALHPLDLNETFGLPIFEGQLFRNWELCRINLQGLRSIAIPFTKVTNPVRELWIDELSYFSAFKLRVVCLSVCQRVAYRACTNKCERCKWPCCEKGNIQTNPILLQPTSVKVPLETSLTEKGDEVCLRTYVCMRLWLCSLCV